ncbi:MAG: hypothetical protein HS111_12765 [Kofleriaceae bacterium]|nr:hypothetical protein [Kofleriaceae bacterium]MCL4224234.1 hypothetical protein [Myxococcales bacterium]
MTPRARTFATAAALAVGAAACSEPPPAACDGVSAAALTHPDRKLVGAAAPYPADGLLRGRDDELARSQMARREVAWAALARALEPVPFAIDPDAGAPAVLPRWHTWYGKDDLRRLFDRLFRGLGADEMRARAPFTDQALDEAFAWNPTALDELDSWTVERWQAYLDALDGADELAGVGGIDRVQYSPGAARHLLAGYAPIVGCEGAPPPPPLADLPTPGPRRMVREALVLAACGERHYGPYFVGAGETLEARVEGAATVRLRAGAAPTLDDADCAGATCTASGPAAVWVAVVTDDGGAATLTVDYHEADGPWAPCLPAPFPLDAAIVKADWRRAELGITIPVFDTTARGLASAFAGDQAWSPIDEADPDPAAIYTLALPDGRRYRLAGLHLMTKELDHWLWITAWWAPDPDRDLGADRPPAITALGGPWRNYKMCVVTAYREQDLDPTGGATASTLAAALAAAHPGAGGPSWCSNPMLELGHGNAASSCVGCHQHGGLRETSETILADSVRFPDNGRAQVRNNFLHDYTWAVGSGDRLGRMFADHVEYWTPP